MKKFIFLSLVLTSFMFSSCLKQDFKIRIENNCSMQITNYKVGPADFGTIASCQTTDYHSITEGSHSISGNYYISPSNQGLLVGSVSITGKGKHSWTISISSTGGCSINED